MSSPIPALNPARSHDHPSAGAAVVSLSRRAQQSTDAPPDAPPDAPLDGMPPPEEGADATQDVPDDLPVPDGNLFVVAGSVEVAPRAMRLGSALRVSADTGGSGRGRPDDAVVGTGRSASGRHVLPMLAPAMPPVANGASVVQAENRLPPTGRMAQLARLPDAHVTRVHDRARPTHVSSLLRSPPPSDVAPVEVPAEAPATPRAGASHAFPLPFPASPPMHAPAARVDGPLPARGPAADVPSLATSIEPLPDQRVGDAHSTPRHTPPRAPDKPMLLHAAGHPPAQLHTDQVRRPGVSVATAKPDPARAELPAAAPAQRIATVSVPFSSWGPGHQVTASWIPAAASSQMPPMTLRSSSESAQRAIGSALASSDLWAPGSLQLTAADSADDGTAGHRQARHVPEDEE